MTNRKNLKQKLKTSFEFSKNLFTTGAITETSRRVEVEITKYIPENRDVIVLEFGMGHGNITQTILNKITPNSKLYSFEVKQDFCEHVDNLIQDSRLKIINDGAENMKKYITQNVDSVISSIPFTFFSNEKGMGIIKDAYDVLGEGSYYNQVLYTKFNFKKFQKIFDDCELIKFNNLPPEYIYHCLKTND